MRNILKSFVFCFLSINCYAEINDMNINNPQYDHILKSARAAEKSLDKMTAEQEYYLGRAVGATILSKFKVLNNKEANTYINKLGIAISLFSERPNTYGGYHFLILDTDEINAFAAPSGHIFISKGLLKLTRNEDEIVAILAHEISHIVLNHGILSIDKSKITTYYDTVVKNAIKDLTSSEFNKMRELFEGSIGDITKTFIDSGYSRKFEQEADINTILLLYGAGLDIYSLNRVLNRMNNVISNENGFGKTHPEPLKRIRDIEINTGVVGFGSSNGAEERYLDFIKQL